VRLPDNSLDPRFKKLQRKLVIAHDQQDHSAVEVAQREMALFCGRASHKRQQHRRSAGAALHARGPAGDGLRPVATTYYFVRLPDTRAGRNGQTQQCAIDFQHRIGTAAGFLTRCSLPTYPSRLEDLRCCSPPVSNSFPLSHHQVRRVSSRSQLGGLPTAEQEAVVRHNTPPGPPKDASHRMGAMLSSR